jgi:hypothetical protein
MKNLHFFVNGLIYGPWLRRLRKSGCGNSAKRSKGWTKSSGKRRSCLPPLWAMGWGFGNKNGGCFSNHNGYPPVTSLAGKSMKIPYNYCKWRFYWGKLTKRKLGFHQILIWG